MLLFCYSKNLFFLLFNASPCISVLSYFLHMDNITIHAKKEEPAKEPAAKEPQPKKDLFSTLSILILAPIIAVLLTIFVFQSYEVDGPSMERTLHHKDRLIVTKTGKTWASLTGNDYIPKRYEIVVFNYTGQNDYEIEKKQLIKRVIGLPGDKVVIKDGKVTIYNEERPGGFNPDEEGPEASVINTTEGEMEQTVKEGEVFVLGDNRANSLDSRAFGPVSSENLVGHLSARIYPFGSIKKF